MHRLLVLTMSQRRFLTVLILLAIAPAAGGVRVQFHIMNGAEPVSDAEICMYPSPGLEGDDPILKYFASDDVRCLPAEKIVAIPEGKWSYIARSGDGLVSHGAGMLVVRGPAEAGYRRVEAQVLRSRIVKFDAVRDSLRSGEFFGVYFPGDRSRLPTATVVPRGSTSVSIPSGVSWIPVISDGTTLRALGHLREESDPASAETELPPAEFERTQGEFDIVGWLRWGAGDPAYIANNTAPVLIAERDGREVAKPVVHPGRTYSDGFFIFKSIRGGAVDITAKGDLWQSSAQTVAVPASSAVAVVSNLPANPAGRIRIVLDRIPVTARAAANARSCKPDEAKANEDLNVSIQLDSCPHLVVTMDHEALKQLPGCVPAARQKSPASKANDAIFGELTEGVYRASVSVGDLPPRLMAVESLPGRSNEYLLDVSAGLVHGRITRGAVPLAARIEFSGGHAYSDPMTGEYAAFLVSNPGRKVIRVQSCEGGIDYHFVPTTEIMAGDAVDVSVPANEIRVTATDKSSGKAVSGGRSFVFSQDEVGGQAFGITTRGPATDETGTAVFTSLPAEKSLRVCVQHDSYEEGCETLTLQPDESRQLKLALRPISTQEGRVESRYPLKDAILMWSDGSGQMTEYVRLKPEGTFQFSKEHGPGEHALIVSATHPLAILRRANQESVVYTVPDVPLRTLSITLAAGTREPDAMIALNIDGFPIPDRALSMHQIGRGSTPEVVGLGPAIIRDIAAETAVMVTRGPGSSRLAGNRSPLLSVCSQPEFRQVCSTRVAPPDGRLVFE